MCCAGHQHVGESSLELNELNPSQSETFQHVTASLAGFLQCISVPGGCWSLYASPCRALWGQWSLRTAGSVSRWCMALMTRLRPPNISQGCGCVLLESDPVLLLRSHTACTHTQTQTLDWLQAQVHYAVVPVGRLSKALNCSAINENICKVALDKGVCQITYDVKVTHR